MSSMLVGSNFHSTILSQVPIMPLARKPLRKIIQFAAGSAKTLPSLQRFYCSSGELTNRTHPIISPDGLEFPRLLEVISSHSVFGYLE